LGGSGYCLLIRRGFDGSDAMDVCVDKLFVVLEVILFPLKRARAKTKRLVKLNRIRKEMYTEVWGQWSMMINANSNDHSFQ